MDVPEWIQILCPESEGWILFTRRGKNDYILKDGSPLPDRVFNPERCSVKFDAECDVGAFKET